MSQLPIPEECSEFLPKGRAADAWRGTEQTLCTHKSGLLENFVPLATDGELTIVKLVHNGSLVIIKAANIVWPKALRDPKPAKPDKPRVSKKASRRLSEAQLEMLANIDADLALMVREGYERADELSGK